MLKFVDLKTIMPSKNKIPGNQKVCNLTFNNLLYLYIVYLLLSCFQEIQCTPRPHVYMLYNPCVLTCVLEKHTIVIPGVGHAPRQIVLRFT